MGREASIWEASPLGNCEAGVERVGVSISRIAPA